MNKFIIENSNYTIRFNQEEKEIEVRYKDINYNHHFIIINNNDAFIINYLNNNINSLWEFIYENYKNDAIVFKLDEYGKYLMIIKKPIYLTYHLKPIEKDKADLRINKLVEENKNLIKIIKELKEEMKEMKEEMKELKEEILPNHFNDKIHLNTYNLTTTSLTIYRHNPSSSLTKSFDSLVLFKNLKKLHIDGRHSTMTPTLPYLNVFDMFKILNYLKLEELIIKDLHNITNLDFINNLHTLKKIELENLDGLNIIDALYKLNNLVNVFITKCPKLCNIQLNYLKIIHYLN